MIVIINDSPKILSKKIRPIIGRYAWRIGRDVWIWPTKSVRQDILQELKSHAEGLRVIFVWPDKSKELGYDFFIHGDATHRQSELGLFNHLSRDED